MPLDATCISFALEVDLGREQESSLALETESLELEPQSLGPRSRVGHVGHVSLRRPITAERYTFLMEALCNEMPPFVKTKAGRGGTWEIQGALMTFVCRKLDGMS